MLSPSDADVLESTLKSVYYRNNWDLVKWIVEQTAVRDDVNALTGAVSHACYSGRAYISSSGS